MSPRVFFNAALLKNLLRRDD